MNPEQPEPQEVYVVQLPYNEDDYHTQYYAESAFIKREHAEKWAKYKKGIVSFKPIPVYNKDICPPPDPEEIKLLGL